MGKFMKGQKKIAHDYYLDCCNKFGVEIVSDKQVRSHYETVIRFDGMEHTQKSLSVYAQGNREKAYGMWVFCNDLSGMYLVSNRQDKLEKYHFWNKLSKEDILYEPKAEKHPLVSICELLEKAWKIADSTPEEDVNENVLNAINKAIAETVASRKRRGL